MFAKPASTMHPKQRLLVLQLLVEVESPCLLPEAVAPRRLLESLEVPKASQWQYLNVGELLKKAVTIQDQGC